MTVRVGIDVGGTFTHAVAIESDSLNLIGQAKVLTTHSSMRGVAEGIISSLHLLLRDASLRPEDISFIAHSTTQATNALLEGDVARVGIIGMGRGIEGSRARGEVAVGEIRLASGKVLSTLSRFLDTARGLEERTVEEALEEFKKSEVGVVVAAEPFSVDDPRGEREVIKLAQARGLLATGTHEISQLYGLRIRTRTAVVNASILPRMVETANMTENAIKEAGITAPLMIMRSDGGVMSIAEVRRRPILTLLSGPAAGVAAALMYAKVSDGIFVEVGGTSTDISVIRFGQALVRSAEVGGHQLYLKTLDVRTVGLAGGSLARVEGKSIQEVGPRSAHIAGYPYASFSEPFRSASVAKISPRTSDPPNYVVITESNSPRSEKVAPTVTCAANVLGLVTPRDYAFGNRRAAEVAFAALARYLGRGLSETATLFLEKASSKIIRVIEKLITEYRLTREDLILVGGGGGVSAILPFTAKKLKLPYRVADNAPVISAIGCALALVHETIERSIVNPTPADIVNLRREAEEAVVRMGAHPETVEVELEVDVKKNTVRALARGALELRHRDLRVREVNAIQKQLAAARSLQISTEHLRSLGETSGFMIFEAEREERKFLFRIKSKAVCVIDQEGLVRLKKKNGRANLVVKKNALEALAAVLERQSRFGDAGEQLPQIILLVRNRMVNLAQLADRRQVMALAELELDKIADDEKLAIISV